MAWFISDTHFNHTNIIKYCNRPFSSTIEMNEHIISKWNDTINKNDTVYHLGDFALQSDKNTVLNLVSQLNGKIILILGNHDRHSKQWFLDCGFAEVYKSVEINQYILSHRPRLIDTLKDRINIHGHIHNAENNLEKSKYINVSCEMLNYVPIWINL